MVPNNFAKAISAKTEPGDRNRGNYRQDHRDDDCDEVDGLDNDDDPDEDFEYAVEAPTETEASDTPGESVFRYLRLLTALVTAANAVPRRLRKLGDDPISKLQVTCFRLEDNSVEAVKDVRARVEPIVEDLKCLAKKRLKTNAQTLECVYEWIDAHCRAPKREDQRPFRIHDEAGMMALLQHMQATSEDVDGLAAMRETLGRVRDSCFHCFDLHTYT